MRERTKLLFAYGRVRSDDAAGNGLLAAPCEPGLACMCRRGERLEAHVWPASFLEALRANAEG